MYADDTVLLSETIEGLQQMLTALKSYTNDWHLTVNTEKTKIVVFRNGGNVRENEKRFFDNRKLEVVNSFNYLGMQARSQDGNEVYAHKGRGFGAALRPQMGPGRSPGGGPGGEAPGS